MFVQLEMPKWEIDEHHCGSLQKICNPEVINRQAEPLEEYYVKEILDAVASHHQVDDTQKVF